MNKVCPHCAEQRCKGHCKCKRDKTAMAKGRHAGRGDVREKAERAVAAAVPAPVGRASPPSNEMLETAEWYRQCCNDIHKAAEVELASYVYDNPSVQDALVKRLKGKATRPFELNVYVDAEQFRGKVPKMQRARLTELRRLHARVWICKGHRGLGSYHCKGAVVDRRFLYTGNANFTAKSLDNKEWCFRMTGPVVRQVLESLAADRLSPRHKLWDGA